MQDAGEQGHVLYDSGGEILLFDREKLEMTRINQLKPFSDDLPNQLFFHLLLDKDGILWLASTSSGVYRLNFPKKQFQLLTEVSPSPVVPERSTSWNQGNTCSLPGAKWGYLGRNPLASLVSPGS